MKSLIKVLVIFWISQTVCCHLDIESVENVQYVHKSKSNILEVFKSSEFFKVIKNCDTTELMNILSKSALERNEISLQIVNYNDSGLLSKLEDLTTELKTILTQCIDPNYIDLVDKLYEGSSKLMKLRSEMTDEDFKELQEMIDAKFDSDCAIESVFQIISCLFTEPEMMQISKSFNNAVNFTIELIDGNDQQCGVANRIEKCVLKSMKKCKSNKLSKQIEYFFNIIMKTFECKVDETIDVS